MLPERKLAQFYAKVSIYRLWGRELAPIDGWPHRVVESLVCWDLRLVAVPADFIEAACFNDRDRILGVFGQALGYCQARCAPTDYLQTRC